MVKNKRIILMIAAVLLLLLMLTGCTKTTQTQQPDPTAVPAAESTATAAPAPTATSTPIPTAAPQLTEPPATSPPQTQPPVVEITAEPVMVATSEYELHYSGSMVDFITYEEIPETPQTDLVFRVKLDSRAEKIFTLVLNSEEGDIVTMINDASGNPVPLAFIMEDVPLNVSPEQEERFCSAQETVNEVIASIILK